MQTIYLHSSALFSFVEVRAPLKNFYLRSVFCLELSNYCFAPTHFLKSQIFGSSSSAYKINPAFKKFKISEQKSPASSRPIKLIIGALILSIPCLILGTGLRITLLATSRFYRQQHTDLVNYWLSKQTNYISSQPLPTVKTLGNIPKDVMTAAAYFSYTDLVNMAKVCKEWKSLTDSLWEAKAKPHLTTASANQSPQRLIQDKLENIHKQLVSIERYAGDKIYAALWQQLLEIPLIHVTTNWDEALGFNNMAATPDYSQIAIRYKNTDNEQGIFTIKKNQTYPFVIPNPKNDLDDDHYRFSFEWYSLKTKQTLSFSANSDFLEKFKKFAAGESISIKDQTLTRF